MKKAFDIFSGAVTLLVPILIEKICSPFLEKIVQYISAWNTCIANWLYQRIAEGEKVNLDFYIIFFQLFSCCFGNFLKSIKALNAVDHVRAIDGFFAELNNYLSRCVHLKTKRNFYLQFV